jgi:hypothetical protein
MTRTARLPPRLLTKAEAASYCGVSLGVFTALCPVRPIALGNDKRLQRYDIVALNKWIDGLGSGSAKLGVDWLATLDKSDDRNSR